MGVDIGGTFTDLAAVSPDGTMVLTGKGLNSGQGLREGVAGALGDAGLRFEDVTDLTHGTTVVTNLLIEANGAAVGLICTTGFRDVIEIGLSYRERTFDARYRKVAALVPRHRRLEVGGRIAADGTELEPLPREDVRAAVRALQERQVESIGIAFYNAYANPAHERAAAEVCKAVAPDLPVTCSTDVDARLGEYERVSTAALNATAVPTMRRYGAELAEVFPCPTLLMNSAGGVLPVNEATERPIQLALSGPAAGVLAARRSALELGFDNAITLDMGGTSADISVIEAGEMRQRESFDVAWGVPARIRSVEIRTIGAGGGSIASRDDGGALAVGPRSAGADPGPACYGRGGVEPTVTDANTVLGILAPDGPMGRSVALDGDLARFALNKLGTDFGVGEVEMARGVHEVVNAHMAQAVRDMTVRHGIDPRSCALVAFGGAGGQHAAGVAAELGIGRVVIPAMSSVLSATGLLFADVRLTVAQTVLKPAEELAGPVTERIWAELTEVARARVAEAEAPDFVFERWAGLRYRDQWHEVALPAGDSDTIVARFNAEHERRFGTRLDEPVEVVDVWITAVGHRATGFGRAAPQFEAARVEGASRHVALADGETDVVARGDLDDAPVRGPLLVEERDTVTFIPPECTVRAQKGHLVMEMAA